MYYYVAYKTNDKSLDVWNGLEPNIKRKLCLKQLQHRIFNVVRQSVYLKSMSQMQHLITLYHSQSTFLLLPKW